MTETKQLIAFDVGGRYCGLVYPTSGRWWFAVSGSESKYLHNEQQARDWLLDHGAVRIVESDCCRCDSPETERK